MGTWLSDITEKGCGQFDLAQTSQRKWCLVIGQVSGWMVKGRKMKDGDRDMREGHAKPAMLGILPSESCGRRAMSDHEARADHRGQVMGLKFQLDIGLMVAQEGMG